MSIVFMYSGQGAQYYRMGVELFYHNSTFREHMFNLDNIVQACLGVSIVDQLYFKSREKHEDFTHTVHSSLAILMVECALTQVLLECGIKPDMVLGTSLGEYAALITAGAREFKEVITILVKQLILLETCCKKGKMIGILCGQDFYENTPVLNELGELAAINYNSHIVVSCAEKDAKQIENYLNKKNVVFQTLPVSNGFHSSLIDPVETEFKRLEADVSCRIPKIPFFSCMYAGEMSTFDENYSWDVFRKPILFQKTIQKLEYLQSHSYIDLGTAGTLANFVKYNLTNESQSSFFPILTPFGRDIINIKSIQSHFYKDPD